MHKETDSAPAAPGLGHPCSPRSQLQGISIPCPARTQPLPGRGVHPAQCCHRAPPGHQHGNPHWSLAITLQYLSSNQLQIESGQNHQHKKCPHQPFNSSTGEKKVLHLIMAFYPIMNRKNKLDSQLRVYLYNFIMCP